MKKLVSLLFGTALLVSTFGVISASAAPPEGKGPGPNGHNDKGLCTAYFNGQKKGHDKHDSQPGPFAAVESHSEAEADRNNDDDDENDVTGTEAIFDYCDGMIGGQPSHGRFLCTADDPDTEDVDEFGCEANEAPGNGQGATSGGGNAKGRNK